MSASLQSAFEEGALRLVFRCVRPDVRPHGLLCSQRGQVSIEAAIKRWGGDKRIDDLKPYCSRCGSRDFVQVTAEPPGRPGKRGRR